MYVYECSNLSCNFIGILVFLHKIGGRGVVYFGVVYLNNYNRNQGTNQHPGNHQRSSRQGAKVLFSTGNCKCANCVVYSQQNQYIYISMQAVEGANHL